MKPTHQPPTRGKWFAAGILTMIADITGTLAQFMPMKAVFILAIDDIPSFFPRVLVNAGPMWTGLALVVAAAILAVISKFSQELALTRSAPTETLPTAKNSRAQSEPSRGPMALLTVKEFAAFVLVFVLFIGSAVVSLTYALSITAWIVGSAVVLGIKIHRGSRKPPYPNGRVEFVAGFRQWMLDSALWSAVGGAILTLVIAFPPLGLTGILLGAVLLRRMQQVVPDMVTPLINHFVGSRSDEQGQSEPGNLAQEPYAFLGTKTGTRLLVASLLEHNLEPTSWRVIGRADRAQMSLSATDKATGLPVILRVFAQDHERSLDHEYALRSHLDEPQLFHHSSMERAFVAGLPSLIIKYGSEATPAFDSPIDGKSAMRWQVEWEVACARSQALQKDLSEYVVDDPATFLLPELTIAEKINGPHQGPVRDVLSRFDQIRARYEDGPRVIHFWGPTSGTKLVRLSGDTFEPLNARRWAVGILGDQWSDSGEFAKILDETLSDSEDAQTIAANAAVRFRSKILSRALRARNMESVEAQARILFGLLQDETDGLA